MCTANSRNCPGLNRPFLVYVEIGRSVLSEMIFNNCVVLFLLIASSSEGEQFSGISNVHVIDLYASSFCSATLRKSLLEIDNPMRSPAFAQNRFRRYLLISTSSQALRLLPRGRTFRIYLSIWSIQPPFVHFCGTQGCQSCISAPIMIGAISMV